MATNRRITIERLETKLAPAPHMSTDENSTLFFRGLLFSCLIETLVALLLFGSGCALVVFINALIPKGW